MHTIFSRSSRLGRPSPTTLRTSRRGNPTREYNSCSRTSWRSGYGRTSEKGRWLGTAAFGKGSGKATKREPNSWRRPGRHRSRGCYSMRLSRSSGSSYSHLTNSATVRTPKGPCPSPTHRLNAYYRGGYSSPTKTRGERRCSTWRCSRSRGSPLGAGFLGAKSSNGRSLSTPIRRRLLGRETGS